MKKIPKLRFPEFSGEWEEHSLEKIAEVNPKTGVVPEKFIYVDLESVENGLLKNENIILKNEAPSRAQRVLKNNDILYQTVRPYQKNNFYFENVNKIYPFVASTGYAQLRTSQSSKYLYHFLHTDKFVDSVLERCTGTSYPAINSSDLKLIKINFPSLLEQEKIASFLSKVDESIEILEEEKELWEKYKKGMMQKIFSQKLRFKDENGNDYPEWEEKRIGDLTKFHQQGYYTKDSYNLNNPYYLLSGANIKKHKIDLANCPKINASAKDFETFKVKKGDILLIRSGNVGDYAIAYEEKNIIFGSYLIKFNLNSQIIINEFFGYFYQSESKERQLKMIIQSSANVNINAENIKSLKITLPTLLEQEKIANFLSSIDEKIEIIEKELEGVKEFKKGLLQQMFV